MNEGNLTLYFPPKVKKCFYWHNLHRFTCCNSVVFLWIRWHNLRIQVFCREGARTILPTSRIEIASVKEIWATKLGVGEAPSHIMFSPGEVLSSYCSRLSVVLFIGKPFLCLILLKTDRTSNAPWWYLFLRNYREKTKQNLTVIFLWLCIILMEAANQVTAYISKLDLWSQQPIRWTDLFWETLISIINKKEFDSNANHLHKNISPLKWPWFDRDLDVWLDLD